MNYSERHVKKTAERLRSKGVRRKKRVQIFFLRFGFVLLLAGTGYAGFLGYRYVHEMIEEVPDIKTVAFTATGTDTKILDSEGDVIATLSASDTYRDQIMLEKIPKDLQNAFIAIEDPEFWSHEGISPAHVLRSAISSLLSGGGFSVGADTITEQLLKNQVYTGHREDDWFAGARRRFEELYLALSTEVRYTKDEILEYYLNTINLGQNTTGVGAASLRYFNKEVSELTLPECALLAAIAKNPVAYNPITHSSRNRKRELQVLTAMQEQGLITSDEYERAILDDVQSRVQRFDPKKKDKQTENKKDKSSNAYSYFEEALKSEVIDDLKSTLGYSDTQAMVALCTGGLTIYSTQDTDLTKICNKILNDPKNYPPKSKFQLFYQLTVQHIDGTQESLGFSDIKKWYDDRGKTIQNSFSSEKKARKVIRPFRRALMRPGDRVIAETIHTTIEPQASFVLIDHKNGEIKTLIGGRGEEDERANERATNSLHQPGTILSTLSTYLPALDTAGETLATVEDDTEYNYPGTDQPVANWYGDAYRGLITLRDAVQASSNVVAVKTLDKVTPKIGYDYLLNLGFSSLVDGYSDDAGQSYTDISLSLALGKLTKGVSNRELTSAYAAIAGGGVYRKPHLYTRILDAEGNTLIDHTSSDSKRVMKASTAWLLTQTMLDTETFSSGMAMAGRSGNTIDGGDRWYVGFSPYLTAGIWCGYDNGAGGKDDVTYHRNLWNKIMKHVNREFVDVDTFEMPAGIVSASICTKCGKLSIDHLCEDAVGGSCQRLEYFTPETLPTETCDCHVRCRICKASGLLAGESCPDSDVSEVVYLLKKDETGDDGKTMDSSLIMPEYLIDSICEVHNTK